MKDLQHAVNLALALPEKNADSSCAGLFFDRDWNDRLIAAEFALWDSVTST